MRVPGRESDDGLAPSTDIRPGGPTLGPRVGDAFLLDLRLPWAAAAMTVKIVAPCGYGGSTPPPRVSTRRPALWVLEVMWDGLCRVSWDVGSGEDRAAGGASAPIAKARSMRCIRHHRPATHDTLGMIMWGFSLPEGSRPDLQLVVPPSS